MCVSWSWLHWNGFKLIYHVSSFLQHNAFSLDDGDIPPVPSGMYISWGFTKYYLSEDSQDTPEYRTWIIWMDIKLTIQNSYGVITNISRNHLKLFESTGVQSPEKSKTGSSAITESKVTAPSAGKWGVHFIVLFILCNVCLSSVFVWHSSGDATDLTVLLKVC